MEESEASGYLERTVLEKLRERGWEVLEARRDGVDLDLSVSFAETRGAIRFRNAFAVSRGGARPEAMPTYLRVDLGEPDGEPSRWAVWDSYRFPGGKNTPRYCAHIYHEAMGETWASVAGCGVAPQQTWYDRVKVVETMLTRAEALAPGQGAAARREQIFLAQRRNFGAQSQRGRDIATVAICFTIGLLLAVAGYYACSEVGANARTAGQGMGGQAVIAAMFGIPCLVLSIIGLVTLIRLLRTPRRPLEGMAAVAQALRGTSAFTEVKMTPQKVRDGLPVVVRDQGYLAEGAAPLSLSRLSARSSAHSITLEADLCRVTWPDGCAPEARLVPDRWLTTELSGERADLAKLPPGPREERRRGVVRWTFTAAEIDGGAVEDHFLKVATSLGDGGGPYR